MVKADKCVCTEDRGDLAKPHLGALLAALVEGKAKALRDEARRVAANGKHSVSATSSPVSLLARRIRHLRHSSSSSSQTPPTRRHGDSDQWDGQPREIDGRKLEKAEGAGAVVPSTMRRVTCRVRARDGDAGAGRPGRRLSLPANPCSPSRHCPDDVVVEFIDELGSGSEHAVMMPAEGREGEGERRAARKERRQRRRTRRRRRRKRACSDQQNIDIDDVSKWTVLDGEVLSSGARWTIIATAGVLLFLCFLLVGVTLRMAPLIDELVRQENERILQESMNVASSNQSALSASALRTGNVAR